MYYYLQDEQGDMVADLFELSGKNNTTLDEVKTVLMKWLFYIDDDNDLVDENGYSYFAEPLEKLIMLTFPPKMYNQPQYKRLKARLDFLNKI